MSSELTSKGRVGLVASNALAALGLDSRSKVELKREGGILFAVLPDRRVAITSAQRWRLYKRGWKARLEKLAHQFGVGEFISVSAGDTVIDVGANVGEFSLAMSGFGASAVAIEGDPTVFECLTINTSGVSGIRLVKEVLWREETDLVFHSEPQDANSSVFEPMGSLQSFDIQVRATTLDRLTEKLGVDGVDLFKCDAEGAEPEVIEGGRETLLRTRQVAIDTGPERMGQRTDEACEALLTGLGFRVFHSTPSRRKVTFGLRD